ncbi:MAG: hypothetical protein AAFO81_13180 [Pseudomonadota bacterium]
MSHTVLFWLTSTMLLLWALAYAGLVVFTFFIASTDHWATLVADGRIKQAYADYIHAIPVWIMWVTLLTAVTRLGGAVALLLQHQWALPLYALSLGCMVLLMFRAFVLADIASVIRPSQVMLEFAFLAISLFAVWFARLQIDVGRLG